MIYDIAVIGGGFFGCQTALRLAGKGLSVLLLEREAVLGTKASTWNQSRIHNGYHYPRSLMTALGAHRNYERFKADFSPYVIDDFSHHYAVPHEQSKVSPLQFERFCRQVGIPFTGVDKAYQGYFDSARIARVYKVDEVGLDTGRLMQGIAQNIMQTPRIRLASGTLCERVRVQDTYIGLDCGDDIYKAKHVLNVTYGGINGLLKASGLEPLLLKTELTEMALVRMPDELRYFGVTVMDGPFFSAIPFGSEGFHTLSHVRYTPHAATMQANVDTYDALQAYTRVAQSHFPFMRNDAARFIPLMRKARFVKSHWQAKVVPQKNELDDGRPILLREHVGKLGEGAVSLTSVLGSKLDSIYELQNVVDSCF